MNGILIKIHHFSGSLCDCEKQRELNEKSFLTKNGMEKMIEVNF